MPMFRELSAEKLQKVIAGESAPFGGNWGQVWSWINCHNGNGNPTPQQYNPYDDF
jgi:hypothetical protein